MDRIYTREQAVWIYMVWQYAGLLFMNLARADGGGRSHWYTAMDDACNRPIFMLRGKVRG